MRKTLKERFDEKWIPEPNSGCWLWIGALTDKRYGAICINGKILKAHRISYELYCEEIPKELYVCHKCDTTICVNPKHLFTGTAKQNSKDMVNKGRSTRGIKNCKNKLTEDQVISIFKDKRIYKEIAKEYKVSIDNIRYIKQQKSWKWLTKDLSAS